MRGLPEVRKVATRVRFKKGGYRSKERTLSRGI